MSKIHETHRNEDGCGGILNSLFGVGAEVCEIRDEDGYVIASGSGFTKESAREDAYENLADKAKK